MQFIIFYTFLSIIIFCKRFLPFRITFIFIIFSLYFLILNKNYGADLNVYLTFFDNPIKFVDKNHTFEFIWFYYIYLMKYFEFTREINLSLILIVSFFIRYLSLRLLTSDKYFLTLGMSSYLATDFIIRDLGQIRNGFAASLFCLSICCFLKYKDKMSKILIVFSSIFHTSYILTIPCLVFVRYLNIKIIILLTIIFYNILNSIVKLSHNYHDQFRFFSLIKSYTAYKIDNITSMPYYIILSIIILILLFFKIEYLNSNFKKIIYIYSLTVSSYVILIHFPHLISRVPSLFSSLNFILIPLVITLYFKNVIIKKFFIIIILILGNIRFYNYIQS